ncbi:MAG: hypothetical protein QOJ19_4997 [Acidimicrobiia bacterium]|nr:hypothetical protein [Acidimicrobiia bacterium]
MRRSRRFCLARLLYRRRGQTSPVAHRAGASHGLEDEIRPMRLPELMPPACLSCRAQQSSAHPPRATAPAASSASDRAEALRAPQLRRSRAALLYKPVVGYRASAGPGRPAVPRTMVPGTGRPGSTKPEGGDPASCSAQSATAPSPKRLVGADLTDRHPRSIVLRIGDGARPLVVQPTRSSVARLAGLDVLFFLALLPLLLAPATDDTSTARRSLVEGF